MRLGKFFIVALSLALPAIALEYIVFTLDSARQYMRGQGGSWKGRLQANVSER